MGEAIAGKSLGKKALLYGALAQSLPDIDFVSSFWMQTSDNLLAHRGLTHSFFFVILFAVITGYLLKKLHPGPGISLRSCILFMGFEMLIHILLDANNNYGTGWFEPFSDYRVSFNTLFVADPLFTIWPLIASILLLIMKTGNRRRIRWSALALMLSGIYLLSCISNKLRIDHRARTTLQSLQLPANKYFTTPTALNSWLWYVVAADTNGYHIGYSSVFDRQKHISFQFFPKNEAWLNELKDEHDLMQLRKFSQGFYTVERWGDTLVFNDLRFGQITGWHNPRAKFAFHYFLQQPKANEMVVQRGRFKGWNRETIHSLVERIKGKP
jgi:inner membrane protein